MPRGAPAAAWCGRHGRRGSRCGPRPAPTVSTGEDPTTWAQALRGADAAYLVHPSDVGAPAATEGVGALAREAVGLGVRRLVLLSARGEEQAPATEEALTGFGVPAQGAEFLVGVFEELLDGRNAHLTDGVRRALGRVPRDFGDFVREAAAAGAWKE